MPLLVRKRQIPIELEAAEGTAETLVAGDVQFGVEDIEGSFTPETHDRNPARETLSHEGVLIGATFGEISGRTELKQRVSTDPVTTSPPFLDVLLASGHAAGAVWEVDSAGAPTGTFTIGEHVTGDDGTPASVYIISASATKIRYILKTGANDVAASETLTGDDSAATVAVHAVPAPVQFGLAYHPSSTAVGSYTIGDYMDGVALTLFGARATGGINVAGVGQPGYLNFTFNGTAGPPVDAALFTASYADITPEVFLSAAVAAHGDALCIDSFNLDFANTLGRRNCANKATGIASYRITDRLPIIAIDPERELEATIPFFTNFAAGTRFGFEATIGQSAGLKTQVVAGRCQYTELPGADREGNAILNAALRLNACTTAGDDEYFICHI